MTLDQKIKTLELNKVKLREQIKIINLFFHWLREKNVFVEGPTGVGKSLVAFFVSEIMNDMGKDGYILTSDISLQNQYRFKIKI